MARFQRLEDWLSWQETLHPNAVDLGLDRCREVAARMDLCDPSAPAPFAIVTVAGTNGKGSCVALLESVLQAAGYHTGAYTSPHLVRYNERVRVAASEVGDAELVRAFERVDQARSATTLTYFEFGTLAAVDIFARAGVEVALLEVGLGGRLDAVNLFDADVALLSTVDVDHVEWLGAERERIALEKSGIFRAGRPAVCGDPEPPAAVAAHAGAIGARLFRVGEEFDYEVGGDGWDWRGPRARLRDLPHPALPGGCQYRNAASVLMVLELLRARLPVAGSAVRTGLREWRLPGRLHRLPGPPERILDVAHNVQAARNLAGELQAWACPGRTHAVLAMLADKDVAGVVEAMRPVVDAWHVAGLGGPRGTTSVEMARRVAAASGPAPLSAYPDVAAAHAAAMKAARPQDRIVIFGSFHTVGEVLRLESSEVRPET